MPATSKESTVHKKSQSRSVKKTRPEQSDVRSVSDARLGRILGQLCRKAETALTERSLPEKSRKAIEKVCVLAKEAIQQQPMTIAPAGAKKKTARKIPR
jgi:hypothetical protein